MNIGCNSCWMPPRWPKTQTELFMKTISDSKQFQRMWECERGSVYTIAREIESNVLDFWRMTRFEGGRLLLAECHLRCAQSGSWNVIVSDIGKRSCGTRFSGFEQILIIQLSCPITQQVWSTSFIHAKSNVSPEHSFQIRKYFTFQVESHAIYWIASSTFISLRLSWELFIHAFNTFFILPLCPSAEHVTRHTARHDCLFREFPKPSVSVASETCTKFIDEHFQTITWLN